VQRLSQSKVSFDQAKLNTEKDKETGKKGRQNIFGRGIKPPEFSPIRDVIMSAADTHYEFILISLGSALNLSFSVIKMDSRI